MAAISAKPCSVVSDIDRTKDFELTLQNASEKLSFLGNDLNKLLWRHSGATTRVL